MEDRIYLGCPKCLSLSKGEGWYITITEATTFKAEVVGDKVETYAVETFSDPEDYRTVIVFHECPDGEEYSDDRYNIDDYIVEVRDGKIIDWGQYWEDNRDELEDLAKENGLVIAE